QERGCNLHLAVGGRPAISELGLGEREVDDIETQVSAWVAEDLPGRIWQPPNAVPLLRDLLELAADARRATESPLVESLERETDDLHRALQEQQATEETRLRSLKLAALAELAAGAGHEINN